MGFMTLRPGRHIKVDQTNVISFILRSPRCERNLQSSFEFGQGTSEFYFTGAKGFLLGKLEEPRPFKAFFVLFFEKQVREMGGNKSKLSKAEIKKLEANTKFTKAEILRWYKGFIQVRHELMPDSIAISMFFPSQ